MSTSTHDALIPSGARPARVPLVHLEKQQRGAHRTSMHQDNAAVALRAIGALLLSPFQASVSARAGRVPELL
jgi:hypothetical protein